MKKIKKNKSMFDELLNAMDMVGFLDEVRHKCIFCFSLSSLSFLYLITILFYK